MQKKHIFITLLILVNRIPVAEATPWEPVLQVLNTPPSAGTEAIYTAPLAADLVETHRLTTRQAQQAWRKLHPRKDFQDRKSWRLAENEHLFTLANAWNDQALTKLKAKTPRPPWEVNKLANKVQEEVARHPVASVAATQTSARNAQIGFCFGRALLAHYYLLKAGLSQDHIAKIYSIGDLLVNGQQWQFHVAVLVRNEVGEYLVIDPLQPKPLPLQDWLAIARDYSVKKKFPRVRFYVTDPRKFLPAFGPYSKELLQEEVYDGYFAKIVATLTPKQKGQSED